MTSLPRLNFRKTAYRELCNALSSSVDDDFKYKNRSWDENWRFTDDSRGRPSSDPIRRGSRLSHTKEATFIAGASRGSKRLIRTRPDIKHTYTSSLRYFLIRPQSENLHLRGSKGKRKSPTKRDSYKGSNVNDRLVSIHSRHGQQRPATRQYQKEGIPPKLRLPIANYDNRSQYHGIANSRHAMQIPAPDQETQEQDSSWSSNSPMAPAHEHKSGSHIEASSGTNIHDKHLVRFKNTKEDHSQTNGEVLINVSSPLGPGYVDRNVSNGQLNSEIANTRNAIQIPAPALVRQDLDSSWSSNSPRAQGHEQESLSRTREYSGTTFHDSDISDKHLVRFKHTKDEHSQTNGEENEQSHFRSSHIDRNVFNSQLNDERNEEVPIENTVYNSNINDTKKDAKQTPNTSEIEKSQTYELMANTASGRSVTLTSIQLQESKSDLDVTNSYTSSSNSNQMQIMESNKTKNGTISVAMPTPMTDAKIIPLQYCDFHRDRIVEYYCKSHATCLCKMCKSFKHSGCPKVSHIKDVSKGVKKSKTLQTVMQKLQNLKMTIENIKQSNTQEQMKLNGEVMRCEQDIGELRQECNDVFNRLESEFNTSLTDIHSEEVKKLSTNMYTLKSATLQVEDIMTSIEKSKERGDNSAIFTSMTKGERVSSVVANTVQKVIENSYRVSLAIQPDNKLKEFLKAVKQLGEIKTNIVRSDEDSTQQPRSIKGLRIVSHAKQNVRLKEDRNACWITGSTFLKNGGTVLCDNFNENLKLLDDNFAIQHVLQLNSPPWDLVAVSESGIVVTLPEEHKLQFITARDMLAPTWSKRTRMMCFGITVHDESIIVACHNNKQAEIIILDSCGHFQTKITLDQVTPEMALVPYQVAVSTDGKRLFLTDQDSVSVRCLTMDGHALYQFANKNDSEISKYSNEDILYPEKLLVDKDDSILVCDYLTNNVNILAKDGQKYRIAMKFDKGLTDGIKKVTSISQREADNTFVLGLWNSDDIYTYTLSK